MADYGTVAVFVEDTLVTVTDYQLAGTTVCPPIPGPPTTGQIWPRGPG